MKNIRPRVITRINWTTLKKQKNTLINVTLSDLDKNTIDDLTGILHLIDALQDYAVDSMGMEECEIFDFDEADN